MLSNRLPFAALGVACMAAAAGGGYLAVRQASTAAPVEAAVASELVPVPAPLDQEADALDPRGGEIAASATRSTNERSDPPPAAAPQARPARPPRPAEPAPTPSTPLPAPEEAIALQPDAPLESWSIDTPAPPLQLEARTPTEPAYAPPLPFFEEFVVPADSVIGLQTEVTISSDHARIEDQVDARIMRDVRVDGEVAIPSGSKAIGSVVVVERGGRFKERSRLGIRFHTLVLADGTRLPVNTETIYRDGETPGNRSAAQIGGGAVAGAILGGLLGGAKGAAVGATAGAGGGTAAVMAGEPRPATFPGGTELTARILSPVTVTIEK